jgi:hypothetical protein
VRPTSETRRESSQRVNKRNIDVCSPMASTSVTEIVCAHSPDSDDAYMFYGLATKKVRSRLLSFRHVLEDIETLNRKALEGAYELTAISYHAYPYVADKYVLMASGSSIGDGYGPILASVKPMAPEEIKGKKIAIPGRMTSAYLALKLFEPDFEEVVIPFDKILDAVAEHSVDAGLIIHEGQLTYGKSGFHNVVDLGRWWKNEVRSAAAAGRERAAAVAARRQKRVLPRDARKHPVRAGSRRRVAELCAAIRARSGAPAG